MRRALLRLDLGGSCMFVGCPPLRRMWLDGIWADLFLLAGGVVVAVVLGVAGGSWCATRPRSRASRALEAAADGVPLHARVRASGSACCCCSRRRSGWSSCRGFFEPHSYAPPLEDPWDFAALDADAVAARRRAAGGGDPAAHARAVPRHDGRGLRAHRAREGRCRTRRVVRRHAGPPHLRRDRVAVRRLGAAHGHEHGARRVRVLRARLLPPHEARARPGARAGRRRSTTRRCRRSRCGRRC